MIRVLRSGVIPAPAATVWRLLRDFNRHDQWHPAVAGSAIEDGEPVDMVGVVRAFRLGDDGQLREQLTALSDYKRSLTYCLLDAPVPLHDYVAKMQVHAVTDSDQSLVVWQSRFVPPPERVEALSRLVAVDIYEAGLAALATRFAAR